MSNTVNISKPTKIFISHSSKDLEYMRAFTDLLDRIHIPADSIVCTSIARYIIPNGENIYGWLRNQFIDYNLHMIFALSDNYYSSCACLNEMGAAWLTAAHKDILLLPGFKFEDIKGCIDKNIVGISLDSDDKLLKTRLGVLKNCLISELDLHPVPDVDWEELRDHFIKKVREIAGSKKDDQRQDLNDTSLTKASKKVIRQKIPKFEIKIDAYERRDSTLQLSIKNVSTVFVSGFKGISFNILDKLGNPYEYANDNATISVPKKIYFNKTSIASGETTLVKINSQIFFNYFFLWKMFFQKDSKLKFVFSCEDEYEEEYIFNAEAVISSADELYRDVWKCNKIN